MDRTRNRQIEVEYLYEDIQKLHAVRAQDQEQTGILQRKLNAMEEANNCKDANITLLQKEIDGLLNKMDALTRENTALKSKMSDSIKTLDLKNNAVFELSMEKVEKTLLQKQLDKLTGELNEHRYKSVTLDEEKRLLISRNNELINLLDNERRYREDLDNKVSPDHVLELRWNTDVSCLYNRHIWLYF